MLLPIYYAKDAKIRLQSLLNEINREIAKAEQTEIEAQPETVKSIKSKYFAISLDLLNALKEITTVFSQLQDTFPWILRGTNMINLLLGQQESIRTSTMHDMKANIEEIIANYGEESDLPNIYYERTYTDSFYSRCKSHANANDFNSDVMRQMVLSIVTETPRTIHYLDASARSPVNFSMIKTYTEENSVTAKTYAINVKEDDSWTYLNASFDRIALGKLKGAKISNESFDVLTLSPLMTTSKEGMHLLEKLERNAIRDSVRYLRPGGVLLLTLPDFRFYKDVCTVLAKGYENIQVRRPGSRIDRSNVYIMATKKQTAAELKEVDKTSYDLLRRLVLNNEIKTIEEEPFLRITLPSDEIEISHFRGSVLNESELENVLASSPCLTQFLSSQGQSSDNTTKKEPLLPFTIGQLGLVLASGALDGVIDEGDGHYHVVKGRVVKKSTVNDSTEEDTNVMTRIDTIANQVEIVAIAADGTIKRLA